MAKILKITGKIISRSLEWLLIFLIVFAFAIRFTPVQTFIAQQATNYLSKELKTNVKIDRLSIIFIDQVILDGVYIEDHQGNKIADLGSVDVKFGYFSQLKNILVFSEATLKNGELHVSRNAENGEFNFQFIIDYFASPKKSSSSKSIDILFKKINLVRINATYDDNRHEKIPFGVDYSHIGASNLFLTASNFKVENGEISAFIKHISLKEQSGFNLSRFSTQLNVSPKGLKFDRLYIVTDESKIYAPKLHLLMNSFADFSVFVDTVNFDAVLNESTVSFRDVSYFATALEGMDQVVDIQATVTQKVKNLDIAGLVLKTGKRTYLEGNFNLPDFRDLDNSRIKENISYAFVDINDLKMVKLPSSGAEKHLDMGEIVDRLKFFELRDFDMNGSMNKFIVEAAKINTELGLVRLKNGLNVQKGENSTYLISQSSADTYDILIEEFQLGKLIQQSTFGNVDGSVNLSAAIGTSGVDITDVKGHFNRLDFNQYAYQNIEVQHASYIKNVFDGDILINDPNLQMAFNGSIDLNKTQHFDVKVNITEAYLNRLHLMKSDSTIFLNASLHADLTGKDINDYSGSVFLDSLNFQSGNQKFEIPVLALNIDRSGELDNITVKSKVINADIKGKIDFTTIASDFNNQFYHTFPSLFTYQKEKKSKIVNQFDYYIQIQNLEDILAIFAPGLHISNGSVLKGRFDKSQQEFLLDIASSRVIYNKFKADSMNLHQIFRDSGITANYAIKRLSMNDSLGIDNVLFATTGNSSQLTSDLSWNPNTTNDAKFSWKTEIKSADDLTFFLQPSYFNISSHRWDIPNEAEISFAPKDIHFNNFLLQREDQYISLNGALSNDETEQLLVRINNFQLDDFSDIIGLNSGIKGVVNGNVTMTNPYENMNFEGDMKVDDLFLNNQEVGDINVNGTWDPEKESVALNGELIYKDDKTFNFTGDYFINKEESLDFYLDFDNTDIQFTNAFLDPKVVSNIKGLLIGKVHVWGKPNAPKVEGDINLSGGNAKVAMFGVNFGVDGKIKIEEDFIGINNIPIFDEDGNIGYVTGTIYHTDFQDWNFDLGINLDEYWDPSIRKIVKVHPFLAMNTGYEEGAIYYGKAYVTGRVNIAGYTDNLDIEVNLNTEKNTAINFPMYGVEEISDDLSFKWSNKDTINDIIESKLDLSEVNLDLNFNVTPDATIKLIFDDQTGDEITASGSGEIGIKLNNTKDLMMDGTFKVASGSYNFVFPPIKKLFKVEPGGTIAWRGGGPTDAFLDLRAIYSLSTSISDISPELESQRSTGNIQPVDAKILLTGSLDAPQMEFLIDAPKASESTKAAINKINSDKDELNKQFFSLLLTNKFQSNRGAGAYGSSAALDALTSQLNALLDQVSKDVRLNVDLKNDPNMGSSKQAIGFETNVLNDKLTIKGNFGVENNAGGSSHSTFIGNLNLEYSIGNSGNLKINIFNESNDYSVIQDKNLGPFTQGVGIRYSEDFEKIKDSRVINVILDLFRKDKHFKFTNKRRQTLLPEYSKDAVKPDEQDSLP